MSQTLSLVSSVFVLVLKLPMAQYSTSEDRNVCNMALLYTAEPEWKREH